MGHRRYESRRKSAVFRRSCGPEIWLSPSFSSFHTPSSRSVRHWSIAYLRTVGLLASALANCPTKVILRKLTDYAKAGADNGTLPLPHARLEWKGCMSVITIVHVYLHSLTVRSTILLFSCSPLISVNIDSLSQSSLSRDQLHRRFLDELEEGSAENSIDCLHNRVIIVDPARKTRVYPGLRATVTASSFNPLHHPVMLAIDCIASRQLNKPGNRTQYSKNNRTLGMEQFSKQYTIRGEFYYSPLPTFISRFAHPACSSFAGSVCTISVLRNKGNPVAMNCPISD